MKIISVDEMLKIIADGKSFYIYDNFYMASKSNRYHTGFILDGTNENVINSAVDACHHIFMVKNEV